MIGKKSAPNEELDPPPLVGTTCSDDGANPVCRLPCSARCSLCSSTSCADLRGLYAYARGACVLSMPTLAVHACSEYSASFRMCVCSAALHAK